MENGVYIGKALVRMVFAVLHCHNRMNGDTINHVCTQRPCCTQSSKIMMDQCVSPILSAPKNYRSCSRIHWFRITQKN